MAHWMYNLYDEGQKVGSCVKMNSKKKKKGRDDEEEESESWIPVKGICFVKAN